MDDVISVKRSFLKEIRAFCNMFASMCENCYHHPCNCTLKDEIQRAKLLIVILDNLRNAEEEKFYIENPNEAYLAKIITAIRQGKGRPVASSSIKIPGENRQRKARALKLLVARRKIKKIITDKEPFYIIANDDNKQQITNNKEKATWHST